MRRRPSPPTARGAAAAPTWKRAYAPAELVHVDCPGCGTARARRVTREFGIELARCSQCRLVYTRLRLPEPQAHYAGSREGALRKYGPIFRGERAHNRDPSYDEHLDLLAAVRSPGDLLDVGSHCGFFLRRARARGWRTKGVEPSPVSAALAREEFGLDVFTGTLDEAAFEPGSFDVVVMLDVFEHVDTPRALLRQVRRVLRPGGHLLVKVPNVRYVLTKQRVLGWVPGLLADALDAREHLVYYSDATLRRVLMEAGFDRVRLFVPSPIPGGGALRNIARASGPRLARRLPLGHATPLATDLLALAYDPERA
jgi:SAM-dependent methyltransferase